MAGTSNISGLESITFTDNMSFDGTERGGAFTTNGQLWIGSSVLPHVKKGSIVSPLGTLTIGYSSPNITLDLAGGSIGIDSFTPDSGTTPVVPDGAGNVAMSGSGSITTVGGTNSLTTQLTGMTNHAVLVGAGTTTLTKLDVGTNGQVLIGATAADPAFATLTSTAGTIVYTLGANTLNLDVVNGGFIWNNVTGTTATAVKSNGYQANNAGLVTITMPSVASSTFGDTIKIAGLGAGGWLLQCVATQLIHFGNTATSAAGSIASTNRYDSIEIVCSSTTTEWFVVSAQGNLSVA